MDAAGEVVEVGDGVEHLAVGDAAMAVVAPHGAYREDKVLPADCVVRAPVGVGDVAAATLPMNGLTAYRAIDLMALLPGQVLTVTGAAGAVGGYVVQLAKAHGLTVVADAAEADEQLVYELGADIVVRRGDEVAARMLQEFRTASTASSMRRFKRSVFCRP
jgi:NADPH:quinone reductase-like Zn-dependent oxidoreductase